MKQTYIYAIILVILFNSCISKPPIPKEENTKKNEVAKIDCIDKNAISEVKKSNENAEIVEQEEHNEVALQYDVPKVVRNWIENEIIPQYGKVISTEWLNNYQIKITTQNGYNWIYGDSVQLKKTFGKYAKYHSL